MEAVMAELRMQQTKWQDGLNLLLAAWLFISPWVLGFAAGATGAAWNAWIVAVVIGVFAIAALVRAQPWEEWVNLFAGGWLFVSPWVLAYAMGNGAAMWNAWIIGALVFVLSIWDLNTQPVMARGRI
jgi:hypothetical protein